jgi:hypothetical protein
MSTLFARVELRGTPAEDTYEKLHAHLAALNWFRSLPGHPTKGMPHAMYQASFAGVPNIAQIADLLKSGIETKVWTKALVLVIQESNWAQTAG